MHFRMPPLKCMGPGVLCLAAMSQDRVGRYEQFDYNLIGSGTIVPVKS